MFDVKLNLQPVSVIQANLGIDPNGRVHKFFTNTCYRYMDKYVPMDFGDLRSDVDIGSDYIAYEAPYAYYQYFGMRADGTHKVQNYTTAGTGPYWDRQMVSAEMQDVIKEVQNYVDYGIGGIL